MAKSHTAILKAFRGKRIVFHGKFAPGELRRLEKMAEAHGGKPAIVLNAATHYLVLADLAAGKVIQKTAAILNDRGAKIQVMDPAAFRQMAALSADDVLALIRGGAKNAAAALADAMGQSPRRPFPTQSKPAFTFAVEQFDGLDLSAFNFDKINFAQCSFRHIKAASVTFNSVVACDFSNANLNSCEFLGVQHTSFRQARAWACTFHGDVVGTDWTDAVLDHGYISGGVKTSVATNVPFAGASLRAARFVTVAMAGPNFQKADLREAEVTSCDWKSADFRSAKLEDAQFTRCTLQNADFSNANLRNVDFTDSDLSGARFDGADLQGANFSKATTTGADFSRALNYLAGSSLIGRAVAAFDAVANQARNISFIFKVVNRKTKRTEIAGLDVHRLRVGIRGITLPPQIDYRHKRRRQTAGAGLMELARHLKNWRIRYETLDVVSALKSPIRGHALENLIVKAIIEATGQSSPEADVLKTALRKKAEKERARRIQSAQTISRIQAKRAKAERLKLARKIEKSVGKVSNIESFLKALALRINPAKLKKATSMLKADSFQLFNDIAPAHLNGVVKSQTDRDLVYACRIESNGHYACCTQNLNICGGLRGSICKHLLVLIIGLVKAGKLDPGDIDRWIAKTHDIKAELNKETMGEIFIRYKGAEAGEVDWRPTETVPEDYYAV